MDNKTILVVDDEPELRNIIALDLEGRGYRTLRASNGRDAFEAVGSRGVDLIISDVRMPGGDGLELLDRVKTCDPMLPVFLVTAFTDLTPEDAYERGADVILLKPYERAILHTSIQKALRPLEKRWGDREGGLRQFPGCLSLKATLRGTPRIGRGGIFVPLEPGQLQRLGPCPVPASISFELLFSDSPFPGTIEGVGSLRWMRSGSSKQLPSGCGIEFEELVESSRKWLVQRIVAESALSFIPKT